MNTFEEYVHHSGTYGLSQVPIFFSEIVNKTFYNSLVQTLRILSISGHCLNVNSAKAITRGLAVSSNRLSKHLERVACMCESIWKLVSICSKTHMSPCLNNHYCSPILHWTFPSNLWEYPKHAVFSEHLSAYSCQPEFLKSKLMIKMQSKVFKV